MTTPIPTQSSRSARSRRTTGTRSSSPQGDGWESGSVYNPAAIVKDGKVVLLYRAHADDIVSHVGLATSDDGIHFERHPEPVLSPTEPYEEFGGEDPRVTEIDGTYYLTYTALGPHVRPAVPGHLDRPVHLGRSTGRCSPTSTPSCRSGNGQDARGARRARSCRSRSTAATSCTSARARSTTPGPTT